MKISFVTTVFNEEKTIERLLISLANQTQKPDEIIIVDAGSIDKTIFLIEKLQKVSPTLMIHIIRVKEVNRARGRNEAIKRATGEIIVVSDAGCVLDKDWVKNIVEPFSPRRSHGFTDVQPATVRGVDVPDVVAGFYQPVAKTIFQKCLACYTSVMPDKVDPDNFLPSSRSMAFCKTAWEKVGGYPEKINYCEDLVFAQNLKEAGCKFVFAPKAIVFWPQKENLVQAFRQFFHYAQGDGEARYWPHVKKIGFIYLRYLIVLAFLIKLPLFYCFIVILLYCYWAIYKNYHYINHPSGFLYLPVLQITADLAVMAGFLKGLTKQR